MKNYTKPSIQDYDVHLVICYSICGAIMWQHTLLSKS